MKLKVVVHETDEGGFWGEVPALPGCASQGETLDELMQNLREAIEGCLLTCPLQSQAANNVCLKSPYDLGFRS